MTNLAETMGLEETVIGIEIEDLVEIEIVTADTAVTEKGEMNSEGNVKMMLEETEGIYRKVLIYSLHYATRQFLACKCKLILTHLCYTSSLHC